MAKTGPKPGTTCIPIEKRFWKYVDPINDGCWLWTGSKTKGYGQIHFNKKNKYAYRIAYEMLIGEFPERLEPDHLCRVRACVNPWHLEPVLRIENTLRASDFNCIGFQRAKTHCPQGHEYSASNTGFTTASSGQLRYCKICKRTQARKAKGITKDRWKIFD